jgi:uncharacterized protein
MKRIVWVLLGWIVVLVPGQADASLNDQCPVNHLSELPPAISSTLPAGNGVESFITLPLTGQPTALVLITAPLWNFACDGKHNEIGRDDPTMRRLYFWAMNEKGWFQADSDDGRLTWSLDTYGRVRVSLTRDGDTTFRLEQYSEFQRTSFSDVLSFKYEQNGKFRITHWKSHSSYLGMYGGGPQDTYEGFEAKKKANPGISDFDGYEGEADYDKKVGWVTKYKFEQVPIKREIEIVTVPGSLKELATPFFPPSFDCSKATTKVELAICNNKKLAVADSDLNDLFAQIKRGCDNEKRTSLINDQRKWLKLRDTACLSDSRSNRDSKFESCLMKTYSDRQKELQDIFDIQNGKPDLPPPDVIRQESIGAHQYEILGNQNIAEIANVFGLRLLGDTNGIKEINASLDKQFHSFVFQEMDSAKKCKERGKSAAGFGAELKILTWFGDFVVIYSKMEGFCDTPNFKLDSYTTYNLTTGKSENVSTWLSDPYRNAISPDTDLGKILMQSYVQQRDSEDTNTCIKEVSFGGQNYGVHLSKDGMKFKSFARTPSCSQFVTVPYITILPFLSSVGIAKLKSIDVMSK